MPNGTISLFYNHYYTNYSGKNDIVEVKVTNDTENMYFYVKTAEDIALGGNSFWRQLFVNTDNYTDNGLYG